MRDFMSAEWKEVFRSNGLEDFERLWNLDAPWFEEPNRRRGGWSGVMRVPLQLADGGEVRIFLKKQENHRRRSLRHPVAGEPTFRAEARNLRLLNSRSVAAPTLLYYAERGSRAMLATLELEGYRPLDEIIGQWRSEGWAGHRQARRRLLLTVARLLNRLHALKRVHNAMHPKHLFVRPESAEACLIDLEKMRYRPLRSLAMMRDLDSLNRRTPYVSRSDRLRFLLAYLGRKKVDNEVRRLWRRLEAKANRKGKKSSAG